MELVGKLFTQRRQRAENEIDLAKVKNGRVMRDRWIERRDRAPAALS